MEGTDVLDRKDDSEDSKDTEETDETQDNDSEEVEVVPSGEELFLGSWRVERWPEYDDAGTMCFYSNGTVSVKDSITGNYSYSHWRWVSDGFMNLYSVIGIVYEYRYVVEDDGNRILWSSVIWPVEEEGPMYILHRL